jgi:hypothetical protein
VGIFEQLKTTEKLTTSLHLNFNHFGQCSTWEQFLSQNKTKRMENILRKLPSDIIVHHIIVHVQINLNLQDEIERYIQSIDVSSSNILPEDWKITRNCIPLSLWIKFLFGYFKTDTSRTPMQIFTSFRTTWLFIMANKSFVSLPYIQSIELFVQYPMVNIELVDKITTSINLLSLKFSCHSSLEKIRTGEQLQMADLSCDSDIDVNELFHNMRESRELAVCRIYSDRLYRGDSNNEIRFTPLLNKKRLRVFKMNYEYPIYGKRDIVGCHCNLFIEFSHFLKDSFRLQELDLVKIPEVNLCDLEYLPNSLRKLNFSTDGILDPYIHYIVKNCPNLELLGLAGCGIGGSSNFDEDYLEDLAKLMDSNLLGRLTSLNLSYNPNLSNVMCLKYLSTNKTLLRLDVYGSSLPAQYEKAKSFIGDNRRVELRGFPREAINN